MAVPRNESIGGPTGTGPWRQFVRRHSSILAGVLLFCFTTLVCSGGCGGGSQEANEASKYPPGQSPQEVDINKQMLEFEKQKKKK
jgi:hypothetical protein